MIILFMHRTFPGQFRNLAFEMAKNPNNLVLFITAEKDSIEVPRISKMIYKLKKEVSPDCHPYLVPYEEAILHAQSVAELALLMKQQGLTPDLIYGYTCGTTMFMKDIFPDVPLLDYFEWYHNAEGADLGFDGSVLTEDQRANTRCRNSQLLVDLVECDAGLSPTYWQRDQFPKEFHHKIKVLHDGVNTELCKPDENAKFTIKDKNLEFSAKDEIITYATRGMEPYRGFVQFMEAIAILQKRRPNAHFIIGGEDVVYYSPKPTDCTYKEYMLQKLNLDMKRVHFVGSLPFNEYVNLLQISSAHVYSTYPFVLSWSLLDAMACATPIIASNTAPVLEVIEDNVNGLLFDFYNVNQLVEKIEYALDNKQEMEKIRQNALQTILDKYALKDLLPQHLEYLESIIKTHKK